MSCRVLTIAFLVHVEEFKKELSREVMGLTHEVGRLQRERQTLEQQIGDLFTFITKQRAELVGGSKSKSCSLSLISF